MSRLNQGQEHLHYCENKTGTTPRGNARLTTLYRSSRGLRCAVPTGRTAGVLADLIFFEVRGRPFPDGKLPLQRRSRAREVFERFERLERADERGRRTDDGKDLLRRRLREDAAQAGRLRRLDEREPSVDASDAAVDQRDLLAAY